MVAATDKLQAMPFDFKRLFDSQAGAKAVPNHPALRGDSPITTYVPGGQPARKQGELAQREANHHLQAYGGSEAMDWVMDCVDLYADTTSSANWHVETPEGTLVEKPNQQFLDLLEAPNPFMDYIELLQLLVIDLLLVGNAYWYKYRVNEEGQPLALYRLSPAHVKVRPGPYGIQSYTYQPEGVKTKLEIQPEEVIHFKRPNPHNPHYGLGVIKGGGRPLDLELALTDATAHYYENKADPSLIVQSERRVPRDVFNKLRQQLRARISGPRNAGELLVLEAGLKATTLQPSAAQAMYAEMATASRNRILSMFRVSPQLLGLTEEGGAGDKVQDARREFDNKVIRPFMDKLQSRITWGLAAAYGYKFIFDYKYIMPPEELVKLAGDVGSVPGIKVSEVRGFLVEGGIIKEESTGDEEIDDMVLNLPGEELDEDGQGGFADRSLPREAGRPPLGENTRAFPKSGKLPAKSQARSTKALPDPDPDAILARLDEIAAERGVKAVPNLETEGNTTVGNKLKGEQRPQDTLEGQRTQQIDAIVNDMRDEILSAVLTLERGLLDHSEGKAVGSVVTRIKGSESWKSFMGLLGAALEKGTTQAVASAAVQHGNEGFTTEGIDYEGIAKEIVYRKDGVRSITDNLRDEIVQKVAKAVENGEDREAVDAAIRESVDFWRQHKAETVALTEATHAYNEGTLTVYEASGVSEVLVYDGDDHDEPCKEANGSVWTIDHARDHRLEHPRCRRAFVAIDPVG